MTPRLIALVALFFALIGLIAVPLGRYIARVFAGENHRSARVLGPVERLIYRLAGVNPAEEHDWKQYAGATLLFSCVTMLVS